MRKILELLNNHFVLDDHSINSIEKILLKYKDDSNAIHLIGQVLQSETEMSFFNKNHFEETVNQKHYFNYNFSIDVGQILSIIYPYKTYKQKSNLFKSVSTSDQSRGIEEIISKGYWVLPELLNEEKVDSIIDGIKNSSFYCRNKLSKVKGYSPRKAESIKSNTAWIDDHNDLLKISTVQELVRDPLILNVVGRAFNSVPIHVQTNVWWSLNFNNSKLSQNANAQMFHQDKEFIKFLKVFVYLNDVDENNGAHVYVEGSHQENKFENDKGYNMSQRISDQNMVDRYGEKKVITMSGKKGSVIIEDTSGFHKGMPVVKGHRILLQIEYAVSLYFNPIPSFSLKGLNRDYLDFIENNKRFALNYHEKRAQQNLKDLRSKRFKKNFKGSIKEKLDKLINH